MKTAEEIEKIAEEYLFKDCTHCTREIHDYECSFYQKVEGFIKGYKYASQLINNKELTDTPKCPHEWADGNHGVYKCIKCGKYNC